jgi:uncharacterized membrane protein
MIRRLVLALGLAAASLGPAPLAIAQEAAGGVVVNVEGWERQVAQTGTTFYRCKPGGTCAAGSTVSYRGQAAAPVPTVAVFRERQDGVNRRMVEQSNGRLSAVELIEVAESTRGSAKVLTAVKALVATSGPRQYLATSLVADGDRHFSIVSTAATEAAARANVATFLPVLLAAPRGATAPPPAQANRPGEPRRTP